MYTSGVNPFPNTPSSSDEGDLSRPNRPPPRPGGRGGVPSRAPPSPSSSATPPSHPPSAAPPRPPIPGRPLGAPPSSTLLQNTYDFPEVPQKPPTLSPSGRGRYRGHNTYSTDSASSETDAAVFPSIPDRAPARPPPSPSGAGARGGRGGRGGGGRGGPAGLVPPPVDRSKKVLPSTTEEGVLLGEAPPIPERPPIPDRSTQQNVSASTVPYPYNLYTSSSSSVGVPSPYASSSSLQSNYSSSGGTSYSSFQSAPVAPSSAHTYDRPQVSSYQTVSSFDMMEIFHDEYTEKINIQEGIPTLQGNLQDCDMNVFENCREALEPLAQLDNCSCFLLHCEKLYLLCQNAPMTIYGAGGSEAHDPQKANSIEIRIGSVTIPLLKPLPSFGARFPYWYLFKNGDLFYAVHVHTLCRGNAQHFDDTLLGFSYFYRNTYKADELKLLRSNWGKTAAVVEGGGRAINRGLVASASFLGKGLQLGSDTYKSNTKGHQASGDPPPLERQDSQDARGVETITEDHVEEGSHMFLQGARGVKQGFDKGLGFVGKKTAKGGHLAYKKYESSDYVRRKEREKRIAAINAGKDPAQLKKSDSQTGSGMLVVGKSSVKAVTSSLAGVKTSARTVGSDVKETSLAIAEHNQGSDAAASQAKVWNSVGYGALGGVYAFQLVRMTSTWYIDAAIATGIGAAQYDPNKKDALSGVPWKCGWLTRRGNMMEPWSLRFAVLRTYSFAVYESPKAKNPTHYVPMEETRIVRPVKEAIVKEKFAFEIQSAGDSWYLSLDLSRFPDENNEMGYKRDLDTEVCAWVNAISALAYFQGGDGRGLGAEPFKTTPNT